MRAPLKTQLPPLRFNPRPKVDVVPLGAHARCVVVDDALADPDALRALCVAQRSQFRQPVANAYPGLEWPAPEAIEAALAEFFRRHVQPQFALRRLERTVARFALVTLPPDRLQPRQWIPHRDSAWVDPAHAIAASVLYLFEDTTLGGTAFYRPRHPEAHMLRLVHDSGVLDADAFAAKYPVARGYAGSGDAFFERIGAIDARWNRMVFYDGRLFHSGDIAAPGRLSDDPLRGRLTLNGFFSGRARA
jgi:hypothetical protein